MKRKSMGLMTGKSMGLMTGKSMGLMTGKSMGLMSGKSMGLKTGKSMGLMPWVASLLVVAVLGFVAPATASAQSADDLLLQGREAFLNYDFRKAATLYAQAKKKAKRNDEFFADKYDTYRHQLTTAENFLGRVEKLVIIDSIAVPKQDFFRSYRLSPSSGHLSGAEALPGRKIEDVNYVFTNEGRDYKLWSQPDSAGYMLPMESMLLTDGTWSQPTPLWEDLSEESDAIYPFLMSDGVTLYYADNGDNSIGGYDIMVATRDAADGTFLQPSNLGFPYNSPYDDYLLAMDELNGVGWWATDRNQLEDEVTLYVFLLNDLRTNYDPDEEDDITSLARIADYKATQPEDSDYTDIMQSILAIDSNADTREADFTFRGKGGKIYHFFDELPGAKARAAMSKYLAAEQDYNQSVEELKGLRLRYNSKPNAKIESSIVTIEKRIDKQRDEVVKLRSEVYKTIGK